MKNKKGENKSRIKSLWGKKKRSNKKKEQENICKICCTATRILSITAVGCQPRKIGKKQSQ